MLEAPAQLATVTMFLLLAVATAPAAGAQARRWWLVAAGVAGATALCTKETFGWWWSWLLLVSCAPAGGSWPDGRPSWSVLTASGYGISVVAMGLSNGFGVWWQAQIGGVLRLVGTQQITGFNSSPGPRVPDLQVPGRRLHLRHVLPDPAAGRWPASACCGG